MKLPSIQNLLPGFKSLLACVLFATAGTSNASLTLINDYAYGGDSAAWDVFYGPNYVRNFSFATGTAGNASNSAEPLTLNASVSGFTPGVFSTWATGPTGSDGATIPGDRELFYTFFAAAVNYRITGIVTEGEMNNFAFQVVKSNGSAGNVSNVQLNGAAAAAFGTGASDANYTAYYWTWASLGLDVGDSFELTFQATSQHSSFDAFQIQTDAQITPEPSRALLLSLGFGCFVARRRRK